MTLRTPLVTAALVLLMASFLGAAVPVGHAAAPGAPVAASTPPASAAPILKSPITPPSTGSPASAPSAVSAVAARAAAPPSPALPSATGWTSSNFFRDVDVAFSGTGLSGPFDVEPIENTIPLTTLGFWMNVTAAAPILFANVTIWSTQWSTTGSPAATNGFSPASPHQIPMSVDLAAPSHASFFFNNYRFFWPGSTVWFNVSVIGSNSTPSEVNSAWNDSVPVPFAGGFVNNATWSYEVGSPWSSTNFTNDIQIATTPSVLGSTTYEPNRNQSVMVDLRAIDLGGTVAPIPMALLQFTVTLNGSSTAYSEAFGPQNQTSMGLLQAIGPYPGGTVQFNVSAWLPWEGGEVDKIASPVFQFQWSPNGGWWHPLGGLTSNLALAISPSIPNAEVGVSVPVLPTAAPVNVSIHEPIENVTISSAQVEFEFLDGGLSHSGSVPMQPITANTSVAVLPGLPSGGELTFYLVAKDINGDPVSSGNYSYEELGPTSPPLPSGRGLVFAEVLDLSGGGLVPGFTYTLSNSTWSTAGSANTYGFAVPLLPGSATPYQLSFGTYELSVRAFGVTQSATVVLSPSSPTPTVVFYGESQPLPVLTTGSLPIDSLAAALGLIAAAIVTLPLVLWYEERRARTEEEQRRVTF
jgi:hypothetical protein